jgi:hypothetical protein
MFNLEQAIAQWRRQMIACGINGLDVLDELEWHLREEVERQMQSGMSAEQAFKVSVQRIGQAGSLKSEFAKVGRGKWALLRKLRAVFVESIDPFPSLDTFTENARETLELARKEAPRLHHNFVGTEHVLLGLLALESGVIPNVLKRLSVNRENLRQQVENWVSNFQSEKTMTSLPYTPRVKRAIALAVGEAKTCNHECVGPEHIFMGLLLEGHGVAGRVLRNLGLHPETTRKEILRELEAAG